MTPDEIVSRLGEAKFKEMFHAINAAAMKKVLTEAGIPAVRMPSHTSTRKRNEDWANRLWKALGPGKSQAWSLFLFEWLTQTRNEMLATFLDSLGVPHQRGLTDADFLNEANEEKLLAVATQLLENGKYDRREAAAYLLFLDASNNNSQKFAPLNLEQFLPA